MTDESGLLYIGDSKMSAISIRAELARKGDFYFVPLAKVGDVPALFERCLEPIVSGSQPATLIYSSDDERQPPEFIAAGYETKRAQTTTLASGETFAWKERILVVRSLSKAEKQFATLKQNLQEADSGDTSLNTGARTRATADSHGSTT